MRPLKAFLLVASLTCGCGGQTQGSDGGMDATSPCTTGDLAVCGGALRCAPPECECTDVLPPSNAGFCLSPGTTTWQDSIGTQCPAPDGRVCVLATVTYGPAWVDTAYELGALFASDGASDRVRYADLGLWTGDPLPEPTSCPNLGNVQACGGMCGECPKGDTCVGRSPLHPVGWCAATDAICSSNPMPPTNYGCPGTGNACFTFTVQPEAQAVADQYGLCLPASDCAALAQAIPGGGKCTAN